MPSRRRVARSGIANEFGLRVTVGAWLDKPMRSATSARFAPSIDLARKHSNINGIVVGNETIYRGDTILLGDEKLIDPG